VYHLDASKFPSAEISYSQGKYSFDSKSEQYFDEAYKKYNMTAKSDRLMKFEIGNTDCLAASGLDIVATPNPAYLYAKPWWMEFFSLTLLIGSALSINVRLVPGMCPYRPMPNLQDLYSVE